MINTSNLKSALREKGQLTITDVAIACRIKPKIARARLRDYLRERGRGNEIGVRSHMTTVSAALRVAKAIH